MRRVFRCLQIDKGRRRSPSACSEMLNKNASPLSYFTCSAATVIVRLFVLGIARARNWISGNFSAACPSANAEGLDRTGGRLRDSLGEARLWAPANRRGPSVFAVGVLNGFFFQKKMARSAMYSWRTTWPLNHLLPQRFHTLRPRNLRGVFFFPNAFFFSKGLGKVSGETRLRVPSDRRGSSALAVGMLRKAAENRSGETCAAPRSLRWSFRRPPPRGEGARCCWRPQPERVSIFGDFSGRADGERPRGSRSDRRVASERARSDGPSMDPTFGSFFSGACRRRTPEGL